MNGLTCIMMLWNIMMPLKITGLLMNLRHIRFNMKVYLLLFTASANTWMSCWQGPIILLLPPGAIAITM